jgi:hypothetical protein
MSLKVLATCALGALIVGCAVQPDSSDPPGAGDAVQREVSDPPAQRGDDGITERRDVGQVHDNAGAEALARVDENLERLRALQVFEVGEMIVDLPAEASNCYGPCPGSEAAIAAANEAAALRLDEVVAVAEVAVDEPGSYLCTELVDENLELLRALEVVEVLGMIQAVPQNNPQCYNLPCQSDIDAAAAVNDLTAAKLDSIARETSGL